MGLFQGNGRNELIDVQSEFVHANWYFEADLSVDAECDLLHHITVRT